MPRPCPAAEETNTVVERMAVASRLKRFTSMLRLFQEDQRWQQ